MNTLTKILLILILLSGLSACASSDSINTDVEQVSNTAMEIADFDLPAGYEPDFSMQAMGYTIASFRADSGPGHLYLIQSDREEDGEKLAGMLDQLVPGSSDTNTRMTIIETRQAEIRGHAATLVISEGVNSEGQTYRQVTAAFQGQGGPALLVLSKPLTSWDQESIDAFIASIR